MSDDPLHPDVCAWLDEAGSAPVGDFVDVLRRAKALPGVDLSEQDLEDAEALPTDEAELRARLNFGTLEDFLDDAAAYVADQGHEEPPTPNWARTERRGGWRWVAAATLVAAAALVWVVRPLGTAGTRDAGATPSAAADRSFSAEGNDARVVPPREPGPPEREAMPEPEVVPEPEVTPEPEAIPEPEEPSTMRPRQTVAALDAEARAAWKAGDLGRARRLFERVVARAGRSERGDVAYGDLFTLARRQGDSKGLRRYWTRYAKRFPRGRYIDDARAGLCRAARGDAQRRCWSAYLEARPEGTYRADAEAALRGP
ncbi:MAG: tetratricopeptide repeat protein [Nannocystaceae bacterium]|nr:hypothetical protein [bacterium]